MKKNFEAKMARRLNIGWVVAFGVLILGLLLGNLILTKTTIAEKISIPGGKVAVGQQKPVEMNPQVKSRVQVNAPASELSEQKITSIRELEDRLRLVLNHLPRKEEITQKDVHHFSGKLLASAHQLASLSDIQVQRGSAESEILLQFYKTCAKEARVLASYRALCLLKVADFSDSLALAKWEDEARIPHEIRRLALQLNL